MIVVTGAAGFIGSCLVERLNREGKTHLLLVDEFRPDAKRNNWHSKQFAITIDRSLFLDVFAHHADDIEFIFHLGARTDTTEFDREILDNLNFDFTTRLFAVAAKHNIPLVYASSAATYGLGENGYADQDDLAFALKPLNPYGESKNEVDKWVLQQTEQPESWKGVKFFNVYGPNEYHKGRMASVVFHAFNQIKATGKMKLFRSHKPEFKDGEQLRDFIYVKDVVEVLWFFYQNRQGNGIYNLGTGKARSFNALAKATFTAMDLPADISYIDTPADIRDTYQYFTEAAMDKLRALGYTKPFTPLEAGVDDYVRNYLSESKYY
jgi:ADP-L-glycero-D-manno-heptose 6-epimerase